MRLYRINASAASKTIVLHAFPGPAGAHVKGEPVFPEVGSQATRNYFHVAQWGWAERVPEDTEAC